MGPSCVVMTVNICIPNQAYQDVTRIIFQIQKLVTLLPVTPATRTKKTIQTTAQNVDCNSNTGDLAARQYTCQSQYGSAVLLVPIFAVLLCQKFVSGKINVEIYNFQTLLIHILKFARPCIVV